MCGLCGIMGVETHWTDAPHDTGLPPRQLRYRRIAAANVFLKPLGLTLGDFHGAQYTLADRIGRVAMLSNILRLWPAVDALAARPPDPLDPSYLLAVGEERTDNR